ncbi:MAG: hypothetical protein AAF900_00420 [Bacteroidota bacterium]
MRTKKLATIFSLICLFGLLGQSKHIQATEEHPEHTSLSTLLEYVCDAVQAHPRVSMAIVGIFFFVAVAAGYSYAQPPPGHTNAVSSTSSPHEYIPMELVDVDKNQNSGQFWAKKKGKFIVGIVLILGIGLALTKQVYRLYMTHSLPSVDSKNLVKAKKHLQNGSTEYNTDAFLSQ